MVEEDKIKNISLYDLSFMDDPLSKKLKKYYEKHYNIDFEAIKRTSLEEDYK